MVNGIEFNKKKKPKKAIMKVLGLLYLFSISGWINILIYRGKATIGRIKIGIVAMIISKIILDLLFGLKKNFQNRRHRKISTVSLLGPTATIKR